MYRLFNLVVANSSMHILPRTLLGYFRILSPLEHIFLPAANSSLSELPKKKKFNGLRAPASIIRLKAKSYYHTNSCTL